MKFFWNVLVDQRYLLGFLLHNALHHISITVFLKKMMTYCEIGEFILKGWVLVRTIELKTVV